MLTDTPGQALTYGDDAIDPEERRKAWNDWNMWRLDDGDYVEVEILTGALGAALTRNIDETLQHFEGKKYSQPTVLGAADPEPFHRVDIDPSNDDLDALLKCIETGVPPVGRVRIGEGDQWNLGIEVTTRETDDAAWSSDDAYKYWEHRSYTPPLMAEGGSVALEVFVEERPKFATPPIISSEQMDRDRALVIPISTRYSGDSKTGWRIESVSLIDMMPSPPPLTNYELLKEDK